MKRQRIIPTVAVYFLFLLAGCTPALPYRSALLTPPPNCPQPPGESVPAACQSSMQEHTASYDLLFVEFDDQGLLYPQDEEGVGEAWQQIDNVMKQLRQIASAENGISLFVFVHGWKHNAAPDDEYVVLFRKMLHAAALVEQSSQEPHRVVGIYLAWRGLSATFSRPWRCIPKT